MIRVPDPDHLLQNEMLGETHHQSVLHLEDDKPPVSPDLHHRKELLDETASPKAHQHEDVDILVIPDRHLVAMIDAVMIVRFRLYPRGEETIAIPDPDHQNGVEDSVEVFRDGVGKL